MFKLLNLLVIKGSEAATVVIKSTSSTLSKTSKIGKLHKTTILI